MSSPTFSNENSVKQHFSFPNPTIRHICDALSSHLNPKLYYKIYFCCKFFYPKCAVIPVFGIHFEESNILLRYKRKSVKIPHNSFKDLKFTMFAFSQFGTMTDSISATFLKQIFSKVSNFHLESLVLNGCALTLEEYEMLTTKMGHLYLCSVSVTTGSNESIVPVEKLLSYIPKCYHFTYAPKFNEISEVYTQKTAEHFASLKRTAKMTNFLFLDVPYIWSAAAISTFLKNNATNKSTLGIGFAPNIENSVKKAFKESVEAVIVTFEQKPRVCIT